MSVGLRAAATAAKPAPRKPGGGGAGVVRIIGGRWKRTPLPVPDRPGLRPTPNRVRETLFDWLGHDLSGWRCIDAFAGSGALGFEAASRGAADVQLWEHDAALVALLKAARDRLVGADAVLRIMRGDGLTALRGLPPGQVDLVLLDPPFDAGLYESALAAAARAIGPNGRIYLEATEAWDETRLGAHALVALRRLRAGSVHAHLLARGAA